MHGQRFKSAFTRIFARMKCTVYVHKNYGSEEQSTTEHSALKNNEKDDSSKVMFQFPKRIDISSGDVIQQKNAHDLWEVYETEDTVISDVFIHFEAKVSKVGAAKPFQQGGNVIIQGSNYGAIQSNSPNATQNVVVNGTNISEQISELKNLLEHDEIDELDQEECNAALDRIEQLAPRSEEPKVAEKIRQKLSVVNGTFKVAQNLAGLASPYIETITNGLGLS